MLGWSKKKSEIESWCLKTQCTESIAERKTMRSSEYEKVGETLYQWFRVQREKDLDLSCRRKLFSFTKNLKMKVILGLQQAMVGWVDGNGDMESNSSTSAGKKQCKLL